MFCFTILIVTRNLPLYPLWTVALIVGLFPVNSWQLGCLLVSISALFGWSIFLLYKNHQNLSVPKEPVLIALGLFWLLAFASIFWSEAPFVSFLGFCVFLALPLTVLTGALCPQDFPFEKIQRILFAVFCSLGIWAFIQFFAFNEIVDGRARHPLANPNALAVIFNIGFFLALGATLQTKDKFALLTAVLCIGGLMMTGSRGALLAALPALLFFTVFAKSFFRQNLKQVVLIACAGAVFFALSSAGDKSNETIAVRTVETLSGAAADPSGNRFEIWTGNFNLIKEHGLTGTGIGTFFLYYNEFRSPGEKNGASHAHSDPMQFWVELGIAGLILFYTVLILVLMRTVTALKKAEAEGPQRLKIVTVFAALLAVAVHAHYSFPLYNLSVLLLTGFVFVVWLSCISDILKPGSLKIFPNLKADLRSAVLIIPLLCCWLVFALYATSEHFVNRARAALFEGRLEEMASDLEIAGRLGFQANSRAYLLAVNVPLALLEQKDVPLPEAQRQAFYNEANAYLKKARQFNARSPSAYYYQARANELAGKNTEEVEGLYQKTLLLDPMHLGARIALADYYKRAGKEELSYQVLKEGLIYRYRAPITQQYLGRVMSEALQRGDLETQKRAARLLKQYYKLLKITEQRSLTGFAGKLFGREQEKITDGKTLTGGF